MKKLTEYIKNNTIRKNYIVKFLLNPKEGYLHNTGWIHSFKSKKPVDKSGNPVPWLTISMIYFLQDRLRDNHCIFEYGAGNSTHFFSSKVGSVFSVEHNMNWYQNLRENVSDNITLYHADLNTEITYTNSIERPQKQFDIIIVDGIERNACCKKGIEFLSENGILILDDSERTEYCEGINHLLNSGFKKLDFWGMAPGNPLLKSSTIFYRSNNCLHI